MLHPIVISADKQLIWDGRRIKVFQHLGLDKILVHVVGIDSILLGKCTENKVRKDYMQSERVAIARALESELGKRRGGDCGNQHAGGKTQNLADCQKGE